MVNFGDAASMKEQFEQAPATLRLHCREGADCGVSLG